MNLSSVTTTVSAPMQSNLVLRLKAPSLEGRETNLLKLLQESTLLTEEEREALEKGRAQLTRAPARAWTYILVHVVYEAIGRFGECVQRDLFSLQDTIEDILREKLPEGTDVEEYVQEFEKKELEFRLIYEKVAAVEQASLQEQDLLYATAEDIHVRIFEGDAAASRAFIDLQKKRLDKAEDIAEQMKGATARMLETAEKAGKIAKECKELGDRDSRDKVRLSGIISRAEDILKGVV